MTLVYLILFSGLLLSLISAYYSIIGLVAIFSAAPVSIMIMGGGLELAKLVVTLWLKVYWNRSSQFIKTYLTLAIVVLMIITSIGCFGFLSKAHLDQATPAGDVAAKIAILDEKIKTQKDNIEAARRALTQMDAAVDQILARSDTEQGAARSAQLRRNQTKERTSLQNDITQAQKEIVKLNDERAPIAGELRKVEAEVGPIKYIAALIYGDRPDASLLENAVRWVIIILVCVFDPLAIFMLLAATESYKWEKELKVTQEESPTESVGQVAPKPVEELVEPPPVLVEEEPPSGTLTDPEVARKAFDTVFYDKPTYFASPGELADAYSSDNYEATDERLDRHAAPLTQFLGPDSAWPFPPGSWESKSDTAATEESVTLERPGDYILDDTEDDEDISNVAPQLKEAMHRWKAENPGKTLKEQRRLLAQGRIDHLPWEDYITAKLPEFTFGTQPPASPDKGDTFIDTAHIPTVLYKYNGSTWIKVDKSTTDSFSYDDAYIAYLVDKISTGQYDPSLLVDSERIQIEDYLTRKNQN